MKGLLLFIPIIENLNKLIELTNQDIDDIQLAKHEELFKRNSEKENLLSQFQTLKEEIDNELQRRSLANEELLSSQEEIDMEVFREKLKEFHNLNKKLSKLVIPVSHFYNEIMHRIEEN